MRCLVVGVSTGEWWERHGGRCLQPRPNIEDDDRGTIYSTNFLKL